MEVRLAPPHPDTGRFDRLDQNRRSALEYFARLLEADERLQGRVLDIGCGHDYPGVRAMADVLKSCPSLDGVDPHPSVADHPHLVNRWCSEFETAPIPADTYDLVLAYNVLEHISRPAPFLQRLSEIMRDGGVFYAFTPHRVHPFALITRTIQGSGVKGLWRRTSRQKINDYPALYRLNSRGSFVRHTRELPFELLELHYLPCVQWDHYFPSPARFLPHLYDRLLGIRVPRLAQLLALRLEKRQVERDDAEQQLK